MASLAACDLTGNRTTFVRPGLLRMQATDSVTFTAPDTVLVNTDFQVSVKTFGGGCDSQGETRIEKLADGTVELRPFDVTNIEGERFCPDILRTFDHAGTLRLTTGGTTTVTVIGRDWNQGSITRARSVVVR